MEAIEKTMYKHAPITTRAKTETTLGFIKIQESLRLNENQPR